jgi:hypothetical protein
MYAYVDIPNKLCLRRRERGSRHKTTKCILKLICTGWKIAFQASQAL